MKKNDPGEEEVTRGDGIYGKHSWKSCHALRGISDHSFRDISANSPYNDTEKEKKELIIFSLLSFIKELDRSIAFMHLRVYAQTRICFLIRVACTALQPANPSRFPRFSGFYSYQNRINETN